MRYYFSKLDKEGREIYKKLYFGMQNFEKKISLKGTENIVREIYYMIIKDNPMMFFVHPSKLTYFKIGNYVWIEPIYVYRQEEANQIMNEINISTTNTVPIPIRVFITALYIFCPVVYDGLIAPFSSV